MTCRICFQTSVHTLGEFQTVKLHLRPSNPQLTPPTIPMQYCYYLIQTFRPQRVHQYFISSILLLLRI